MRKKKHLVAIVTLDLKVFPWKYAEHAVMSSLIQPFRIPVRRRAKAMGFF